MTTRILMFTKSQPYPDETPPTHPPEEPEFLFHTTVRTSP